MRLFFPSAIVTEFAYTSEICNVHNKVISAEISDVIDIDYGFSFLLSASQGKIITSKKLQNIILPCSPVSPMTRTISLFWVKLFL